MTGRPKPEPTKPDTWQIGAGPRSPMGHHDRAREAAAGRPTDDAVVDVKVHRGLRGGKVDVVPLTPDEAVELATELLDAVRTIKVRTALRNHRQEPTP